MCTHAGTCVPRVTLHARLHLWTSCFRCVVRVAERGVCSALCILCAVVRDACFLLLWLRKPLELLRARSCRHQDPCCQWRVPGPKLCCSPGKSTVGTAHSSSLGTNALLGLSLSSTPHLPLPAPAAPSTVAPSQRSRLCGRGGCLRLSWSCHPPRCLCSRILPGCQAQPLWEVSLGTFTPDSVLIASSPASASTSELVTESPCHVTTSVPKQGRGAARGHGGRLRGA